jgi:hypothetical protein
MSDSPDVQELYQLLLDASRAAFGSVIHQHPDETFYAFSLFHEPLWAYIYPTANTEEGLIRVAQIYKRDEDNMGYAQRSIEELARQLRWNPADWAYHDIDTKYFDAVSDWLTHHDIYWRYKEDEAKWDEMNDRIIAICRMVMNSLDEEGLFGTALARAKITLNIMMGDQDRSWLEHARLLNLQAVYVHWLEELKMSYPGYLD